jgi:hypothetical protein
MDAQGRAPPKATGYVRSVLREIGRTITHPPAIRRSDRRIFVFLIAVFVVVFSLLGVTFYLFANQVRPPPSSPIVFSNAVMSGGNATIRVEGVDGGPFPASGFALNLMVNNFAGSQVALPPNNETASIPIGAFVYRITWMDTNHDGDVSVGDVFTVTGSGVRLPSLSYCAFQLIWEGGAWSAAVYWTTSSE